MNSELSLAFDELEQFDQQLSGNYAYLMVSHRESDGQYKSCKISLDSLAEQLNSFISGIKSVAYTQSSDFASIDHDHDIYTSATYASIPMVLSDTLSVMSLKHGNQSFVVNLSVAPPDEPLNVYEYLSAYQYKLGTLHLMGTHSMNSYSDKIDYKNSNFTGWVPANGASYNIADFFLSNEMHKVFSTSGSKFTVPALTDFININVDPAGSNGSYYSINGSVNLKYHAHPVIQQNGSFWASNTTDLQSQNAIDSVMDMLSRISWSQNDNNSRDADFMFKTNDNKKIRTVIFEAVAKKSTTSSRVYTGATANYGKIYAGSNVVRSSASFSTSSSETGLAAEAYPSHNLVPVLIYIGFSKYANLNQYVSIM